MSSRIQSVLFLSLFTLLAACGEYSEEQEFFDSLTSENNDIYVPANVDCSPSRVNGFYETMTIRRSGLCPDLDPFFLHMKDGKMSWGENCSTESVSFSEQLCQQDTHIVCQSEENEITIHARLAQLEEQGMILTGTMTIQFKHGSSESSIACLSEYQTKLERL